MYNLVQTLWGFDPHPNIYSPFYNASDDTDLKVLLAAIGGLLGLVSSVLMLRGVGWGRWLFVLFLFYMPAMQHYFAAMAMWKIAAWTSVWLLFLLLIFLPSANAYFAARYKV
jgi:hypothetical protein